MKHHGLLARLRTLVRRFVSLKTILPLFNLYVCIKAKQRGFSIRRRRNIIRIIQNDKEIRLSKQQAVYLNDTIDNFDFYYSAVKPVKHNNLYLVDYSTPRRHEVKDFDLFPVLFPSVAEPVLTIQQYIEFAGLKENAVVIDLGAYSGLTSILFDMAIPASGIVIALEADPRNSIACEVNFAAYERLTQRRITLIKSAIWRDGHGVQFSSEGSMGSSVVDIVGVGRGDSITVPSVTLDQMAMNQHLDHVDFIKCDIEGVETEIFQSQGGFFARYKPKIMIECHFVNGESTAAKCSQVLARFGYDCQLVEQKGYPLPLLACTPSTRKMN